ncbi:MAG: HAMP domain-containing sensor histidine kinase [Pseudomonadota bacterium]
MPLAALPLVSMVLGDFSTIHLIAIVSLSTFALPARALSNTASVQIVARWFLFAALTSTVAITAAFPSMWLGSLLFLLFASTPIVLNDKLSWMIVAPLAVGYAAWLHMAFLGQPHTDVATWISAGTVLAVAVCVARFWPLTPAAQVQGTSLSRIRMDRVGHILECSGELCSDLGLGVSSEPLLHRVHVTDRVALLAALDSTLDQGRQEDLVCRIQTHDGGWKSVRLIMVAAGGGTVEAHVACNEVQANMAARIDLLEQELATAKGSKTRFIATMSHELRTPLNAILGFSDLLRQHLAGPVTDRQEEYLNDIHGAGKHLLTIVNDILDASKIEAGYYQLACDDFEVEPVLAAACSLVEGSRNGTGVRVRSRIQPGIHSIYADPKAFKQIIINLMGNAAKFSHDGGEVLVSLERQHKGLLLTVKDHGVGMSADDLAAACEPFVQAENDHSRQAEGTGLGLAIVKGFVDLHGGQMEMNSRLGEGTTVQIYLPNSEPVSAGDAAIDDDIVVALPTGIQTVPSMVTPMPGQPMDTEAVADEPTFDELVADSALAARQ